MEIWLKLVHIFIRYFNLYVIYLDRLSKILLQEQTTTATVTADTQVQAVADQEDNEAINITPAGLSGILVSLSLVGVLVIALSLLTSIQTPAFFVTKPLNFGREQL